MKAMQNLNDPKPIQEVMGESTLSAIIQKAQILDKIDRCLTEILPETYADYCRVMNVKGGCLVISASNSAIATRLRYQEEGLLRKLRQELGLNDIVQLEVVVRPR